MSCSQADFYDSEYFLGTSKRRGNFSLLELGPKFQDRAQTVIDYFDLKRAASGIIAEIGCGTAPFYRIITRLPELSKLTVICTDITMQGVMLVPADERPLLRIASADSLPFDSNFLDGAILWDVLEHIENPERVLNEVYRTLKPGGFLHIICPNPDSWARKSSEPEKDVYRRDESHIFPPIVTTDYLDETLTKVGFSFEQFTRGFKVSNIKNQTGLAAMRPACIDPKGTHIVVFAWKAKLQ